MATEKMASQAISRYGKEGFEIHHGKEGTAMVVSFRLNDMNFMALNGGRQRNTIIPPRGALTHLMLHRKCQQHIPIHLAEHPIT
jgi:predicted 3-demethylubiquinone-9 3-methyltransferase (glyoxalase superfamily)